MTIADSYKPKILVVEDSYLTAEAVGLINSSARCDKEGTANVPRLLHKQRPRRLSWKRTVAGYSSGWRRMGSDNRSQTAS